MEYTLKLSGNVSNRTNAFDKDGNKLFVIENGYSENKELDANILKLINAAPDLLDALQKVYKLAKQAGLQEDLDFEEFDYIESAINKAL